jgi:hypothetical protein
MLLNPATIRLSAAATILGIATMAGFSATAQEAASTAAPTSPAKVYAENLCRRQGVDVGTDLFDGCVKAAAEVYGRSASTVSKPKAKSRAEKKLEAQADATCSTITEKGSAAYGECTKDAYAQYSKIAGDRRERINDAIIESTSAFQASFQERLRQQKEQQREQRVDRALDALANPRSITCTTYANRTTCN